MENGKHVSEEALERYALRPIFGFQAIRIEEHLLVCSECRDRFQALTEFLALIRAGLAKLRRGKRPAPKRFRSGSTG